MKWVAKRDFYRTTELQDLSILGAVKGADKEAPHADHIHEGALFEYGTSKDESDLLDPNSRDPKKGIIAQLRYAGCIGNAEDPKVLAKVTESIATKNKREENLAKIAARADNSDLVQALTKLLSKAAASATAE